MKLAALCCLCYVAVIIHNTSVEATHHGLAAHSGGTSSSSKILFNRTFRGGAVGRKKRKNDEVDEDAELYEDEEELTSYDQDTALWLLNQMHVYHARTALLAKELRKTGHLTGLAAIVQEERGNKLDIALSTEEKPMPCRIYYEAEAGSKVVAPCKCKGTQKWIQWSALNQQWRNEPHKFKNCNTCKTPIDYKLYYSFAAGSTQWLSALLERPARLQALVAAGLAGGAALLGLLLHGLVARALLSAALWRNYHRALGVVYAPLPLKIFVLQLTYKPVLKSFDRLVKRLRDRLVEWESALVQQALPVTVVNGDSDSA